MSEVKHNNQTAANDGSDVGQSRGKAAAWKEMLGKLRNRLLTLAGFTYEKGNTLSFGKFLKMFEPADQKLPYEPLRKGQGG